MNDKTPKDEDLTGRDRFAWNVISSWGGYLFVLIPGFIMPRMISDYQGSAALGVWDFSWAFVHYLRISGFGIGTSVSRYVAKHRAEKDVDALRNAVSTVMFIQLLIAAFVLVATIVLAYVLPELYKERLGEFAGETRWVILLLGGTLVIYFMVDVFRGVITGSHRWDIHNAIIAGTHGTNFASMVLTLVLGGGLLELSIVYFSVSLISEIVRVYSGFKVCRDLRVHPSYVSWKRAKKMMSFGIKTILIELPSLLIIQSTNVMVMGALGPALLAVLMRPIALIRHLATFVSKYAFVLTPMAGSIQTSQDAEEMRTFVIETSKYSVAFTFPLILFLVVFGDIILYIWMGEGYDKWSLMAILALGYFLPISQNSAMRILVGLNAHGRTAMVTVGVALVVFVIGTIIVRSVGWSLDNAAILVAVSMTLSQGVAVPLFVCHKLQINVFTYLRSVFLVPVLCGLVYALILVSARAGLENSPGQAMIVGGFVGGTVLLFMYWKWIANANFRAKIGNAFKKT